MDVSPPVVFTEERYHDCIGEARPLLERHWDEIARHKDTIKLAPDGPCYARADERGQLLIVTARRQGVLIGYAAYFTAPGHPHYATTSWATSDIFYIVPEERAPRVALKLFETVEEKLRARGIKIMHTREKIAHASAGALLEYLGHEPIETVYAKALF